VFFDEPFYRAERRYIIVSAATRSRDLNMTEGPILGKMIRFTLPVMLSGILQLLFNAADVAVVGQFAGDAAMAAVGSCGALINLIVNLFIGLAVGAGVIAAQDLGARRYDDVTKLVSTSLTASLVGGVAVMLLGMVLAEPLLVLMKTPDDVLAEAVAKVFDFRPAAIIDTLKLRRPQYRALAAYGHIGREDLDVVWEKTDRVEALKALVEKH
jgi:O-antigen/teichoic acid export membrane protein